MQIVITLKMQLENMTRFQSLQMEQSGVPSMRGWHNFYLNVGAHDRHTYTHTHVYLNVHNRELASEKRGTNKTIKAATLGC